MPNFCSTYGRGIQRLSGKYWTTFILERFWIFFLGYLGISTEERHPFIYWFGSRCFPSVQYTLQNGHTKIERVEDVARRNFEEGG